jgi:hypothetical protein
MRVAALAATLALAASAWAEVEKRDMELVGHHDLQGRSAYQPVVQRQGNRWIAYVGLHGGRSRNPLTGLDEDNGTAIIDVTDPRQPTTLSHIPGEPGHGYSGGAQMVRVCDGASLPRGEKSRFYLLRTYGNAAHEIWDVTAPARPARLTTVVEGLAGTHKNFWECDSGIAYLVSGAAGWRTHRMTQVYDLSDPARPRFIRNFGLPGQQPGATGAVPTGLHGAISTGRKGNRVYFGYGTNSSGILQIVDRARLLDGPYEPTEANLRLPEVGRLDLPSTMGAHTTFPLGDYVLIVNESLADACREPRQKVWMADVRTESKPSLVSSWTVPEASGNFCSRGGRFGAHSSHESFSPIYYKRLMFIAFFNAGVRVLDIRDPRAMREVAHYIPASTSNTDKGVIQTNNVEVDDRGYVYIVDRAGTGMHILELRGDARNLANWP